MTISDFDRLHSEYRIPVQAIIRRRIPAVDIPDIEQDTWTAIWTALQDGAAPANARAWVFTLARSACSTYHAAHRHDGPSLDAPAGYNEDGDSITLAEMLPAGEQAIDPTPALLDALRESVDRLSPILREVVEAHYFHGLPVAEIALLLGAPVGTITARLTRARTALREMLLPDDIADAA